MKPRIVLLVTAMGIIITACANAAEISVELSTVPVLYSNGPTCTIIQNRISNNSDLHVVIRYTLYGRIESEDINHTNIGSEVSANDSVGWKTLYPLSNNKWGCMDLFSMAKQNLKPRVEICQAQGLNEGQCQRLVHFLWIKLPFMPIRPVDANVQSSPPAGWHCSNGQCYPAGMLR